MGNARLAAGSVPKEAAAALDATDKDVAIGGAGLAAAGIELGLVGERRMFRNPVVVGVVTGDRRGIGTECDELLALYCWRWDAIQA